MLAQTSVGEDQVGFCIPDVERPSSITTVFPNCLEFLQAFVFGAPVAFTRAAEPRIAPRDHLFLHCPRYLPGDISRGTCLDCSAGIIVIVSVMSWQGAVVSEVQFSD